MGGTFQTGDYLYSPPPFITINDCKRVGANENMSSVSLLCVAMQIMGGVLFGQVTSCTPPPLFITINNCKRVGANENISSFSLLCVAMQIKGGEYFSDS